MSGRRERPDTLKSETHRIETGNGKVYVTIGLDDEENPFEVFVNMGDSGGFTNSWCEALGKSLSNALRSGTDPEVLADDLIGIRTDAIGVDNGDRVHSIPEGIGLALKRSVLDKQGEPIKGDAGEEMETHHDMGDD